jgi:uncharacterized protein YlaN (UPF0358 family)
MTNNDYLCLLLEQSYFSRLLGGLQHEEQVCLHNISKFKHDITHNAKLPRIRNDIAVAQALLKIQTDLINSKLQKTYDFQFKSFTVPDMPEYEEVSKAQQIQGDQNKVQREDLPQQEGGESRPELRIVAQSDESKG